MSWLRTLRPASFRGVPFAVFFATKDFGRDVITHVFPLRDRPFHEDMRRSTRVFSIDAFVVGGDVQAKVKRLEAALEAKGAGRLVHPYYGSLQVVALKSSTLFAAFEGRVARVSIAFEEASASPAPLAIVNTIASLLSATGLVSSAVFDAASSALSIADQSAHIREAFAGDLSSIADAIGGVLSLSGLRPAASRLGDVVPVHGARPISVADALDRLASARPDAQTAPALDLVQRTVQAVALARPPAKTFSDERDEAVRVVDATLSFPGALRPRVSPSSAVTANREVLATVLDAAAATASVEAATAVVWDSRDQLASYGERIATLIDATADRAGLLGWDEAWRELVDLGSSFAVHVARQSPPLPRVRRIVLPATMPSSVLAYQLDGDDLGSLFGRAGSIARRNGALRPGFLAAGDELEVIADA